MWKVIIIATVLASTCYAFAGLFGYASFALMPDVSEIMEKENILEAPYEGNGWIVAS